MKHRIPCSFVLSSSLLAAVLLAGTARAQMAGGMAGPRTFNPPVARPAAYTNSLNPYSAPSPYGAYMGSGMGHGAHGYSQGSGQGYGSGMSSAATGSAYSGDSSSNPQATELSSMLFASGVPNDNGQLRWPIGLRVLAGPQVDELRAQIENLFQQAASPGSEVNSDLTHELHRAIVALCQALRKDKNERFSLPLAVYDESERFLNRLERGERLLSKGLGARTTRSTMTTTQSSPAPAKDSVTEVDLYDNFFAPTLLYVPVGTTVRWKNHGLHGHTVTSDDGQWSSREMRMGESYDYGFTQPGTYSYHCAVHAKEMRGVVVVK